MIDVLILLVFDRSVYVKTGDVMQAMKGSPIISKSVRQYS